MIHSISSVNMRPNLRDREWRKKEFDKKKSESVLSLNVLLKRMKILKKLTSARVVDNKKKTGQPWVETMINPSSLFLDRGTDIAHKGDWIPHSRWCCIKSLLSQILKRELFKTSKGSSRNEISRSGEKRQERCEDPCEKRSLKHD